jgi:hypothetical protein
MSKKPAEPANASLDWGKRQLWIILGWVLMLSAPIVGAIPGPGFLIVFPIGLALVLKNSRWAKRQYLIFAKANPEYGQWMHWALRRQRSTERPPVPNIWEDILYLFRRDDLDQKPD